MRAAPYLLLGPYLLLPPELPLPPLLLPLLLLPAQMATLGMISQPSLGHGGCRQAADFFLFGGTPPHVKFRSQTQRLLRQTLKLLGQTLRLPGQTVRAQGPMWGLLGQESAP